MKTLQKTGYIAFLLFITQVTAQTETLKILPNGKVGIGTSTPKTKLDVKGNINTSGKIQENGYNLVPTGSILPFIGTEVPGGWLLCNGNAIPNPTTSGAALKALIGTKTPDLQGMFLRGVGTSPVNSQNGPALNTTQGDDNKSHSHVQKGEFSTNTTGSHSHTYYDAYQTRVSNGWKDGGADYAQSSATYRTSNSAGNHAHKVTISGNTNYSGGTETRPVNYGVNYIIKL